MRIIPSQEDKNILTLLLETDALDANDSLFFKQRIMEIINETKCYQVIINMEQLNFIDNSGLESILSLLRTLHSKGGRLKICAPTKSIHTVFELVCMHKIFEIYPTHEEALQSFTNF